MRLPVPTAFLACLSLSAAMAPAVTLTAVYTTTTASDDNCNPGPRNSNFLGTDPSVWLYVSVSSAAADDRLRADWIRPDGKLYTSVSFDPIPSAGDWCFDTSIAIAGDAAAQYPGTWTVKGYWNSAALFTTNFTLSASGSGTNLIQNPGAEQGPGDPVCNTAATTVPGWTIKGNVAICSYGPFTIAPTAPGPVGRGGNYFTGGPANSDSSLFQRIDVSGRAASIDTGGAAYTLSGWLGGSDGKDDNAALTVTFRDASNGSRGTARIGPVLLAERNWADGLVLKTATGTVPVGTRSIDAVLEFTRASGVYNYGAADALSLMLGSGSGGNCSLSINPSSNSVPAGGGDAQVTVATAAGCAWTAASNVSWITVTAGASGSGNGTVGYSVAANSSTLSRTGTLTVAGRTYTVQQAGVPAGPAPSISTGGIMNAASFMPASLPAGAIARGSFFSIFGSNMGPTQPVSQTSYPLPATLGQVTVQIRQGSTTVNAYLVFVSAGQINAIMPSNAPPGDVQIVVTYAGAVGIAGPAKIVASNFGIFTASAGSGPAIVQNYVSPTQLPLNTRSTPAKPGQVAILLGTGLGAITAPDNQAPPVGDLPIPVQVTVGGKAATRLYSGRMPGVAGVDQINFQVPADAPPGCYVPVQVQVGNAFSNTATMAIQADGQACADPQNPFGDLAASGGKRGAIFLIRLSLLAQLEAGKPPADLLLDLGLAAFEDNAGRGDMAFNPLFSLPPIGSCVSYAGNADIGGLLGGNTSGVLSMEGILGKDLDAGPGITVARPQGATVQLQHMNSDTGTGPYIGLLGGTLPIDGMPSLPMFLEPGNVNISGTGGKDVGPFQTSITLGTPVVWSNRDQITQVNRAAGLTLKWTGGDASKLMLIGGAASDETNKATGLFFCFVPAAPGSFTVPASVLGNLPATNAADPQNTIGLLLVGSLPSGNYPTFTASGIDSGLIFNFMLAGETVSFQ